MKNTHASEGLAEDLIRSIVQIGSAEMHEKTILEKRISELENGLIDVENDDVVSQQIEKIEEAKQSLCELAAVRRADMLFLFDLFEGKGDKEKWCMVKHLGIAMMTAFEAWQASEQDDQLLEMALNKNRLFIKAISQFIGVEITDCASCFSDMMKGVS